MPTIAILDDAKRLVGTKKVKNPKEDDLVVTDKIDLPLDGTYKWDGDAKAFVPLGHGFKRIQPAPCPEALVTYQLAKATRNPSKEIREWMTWYEENLLVRHQEAVAAHKSRRR